ncbi:MAG: type II toxin-antitoxin system VapC family toxin [Planctomycetales bacterium]|nr:type II toxin-antitoxin system VapC family toxin [Planctomycetales bacterium]
MAGRILLDTNAIIAIIAKDAAVAATLASFQAGLVSAVSMGELYYGAEKSARKQANLLTLERFSQTVRILPCGKPTAVVYGQLKHQLAAKGRPIPDNDLWIAAVAVQHGLALISRDAHFDAVSGLTRVAW